MTVTKNRNRPSLSIPYQVRVRGYEADKQKVIPLCDSAKDVERALSALRDKWRI